MGQVLTFPGPSAALRRAHASPVLKLATRAERIAFHAGLKAGHAGEPPIGGAIARAAFVRGHTLGVKLRAQGPLVWFERTAPRLARTARPKGARS